MNEKYYIIKKKNLAEAINFITGMRFYVMDDRLDSNNKFYSFENTELFRQALTELTQLKSKFNNNI
ncbi:MAG: hypothetical protein Q8936_22425 [Bacillota bacterium]|nr:hypothetical protein [Bacillota bacterium]